MTQAQWVEPRRINNPLPRVKYEDWHRRYLQARHKLFHGKVDEANREFDQLIEEAKTSGRD